MEYIFLLLGLFLLIKGADVFVDGAASVAAKFKVPSLIIGLTVVSFGTSAPEAAISISASLSGSNSISLGNVIGSNFFNLLIVIGITALVTPLKADDEVIRRDMPAVILATGGLAIIILDSVIMRYEAIILLAALVFYLFAVIKKALASPTEDTERKHYSWFLSVLMVAGGVGAVVFGGDMVVDNAKIIASDFGMSETLIGLTVVALHCCKNCIYGSEKCGLSLVNTESVFFNGKGNINNLNACDLLGKSLCGLLVDHAEVNVSVLHITNCKSAVIVLSRGEAVNAVKAPVSIAVNEILRGGCSLYTDFVGHLIACARSECDCHSCDHCNCENKRNNLFHFFVLQ